VEDLGLKEKEVLRLMEAEAVGEILGKKSGKNMLLVPASF